MTKNDKEYTLQELVDIPLSVPEPKRIFDDPDHKHYGPVRRMWVMLAQMDLLTAADEFFGTEGGETWDEVLARECDRLSDSYPLTYEVHAQRHILYLTLDQALTDAPREWDGK